MIIVCGIYAKAIKLARAVYFMLRDGTVFDPERLVAALTHK
jgi:hypothetical protein